MWNFARNFFVFVIWMTFQVRDFQDVQSINKFVDSSKVVDNCDFWAFFSSIQNKQCWNALYVWITISALLNFPSSCYLRGLSACLHQKIKRRWLYWVRPLNQYNFEIRWIHIADTRRVVSWKELVAVLTDLIEALRLLTDIDLKSE